MKLLKTGFTLSIFALFLIGCKTAVQSINIKSISYTQTAGRGGAMSVTADKDSLEYSARGRISEFPNFKKKINQKDWENLISGIDLKAIEQTKSGERRGLYDGSDEIFRIETSEKEYEIVNASVDSENYKQLEKLKINLNNLVSKYK